MTRYAHWLLPLVGPFVLLGMARAVWWAAGAEWPASQEAAFVCLLVGTGFGLVAAVGIEVGE